MKRGGAVRSSENFKGLSEYEALRKLKKFGLNRVERKKRDSWLRILAAQLENTLVLLLILATAVSFLIGEEISAVVILSTLILNIALGFFEDFKAENELRGLSSSYKEKAVVIRDGRRKIIDAEQIVPGDLVVLEEGMKIPADGYLVYSEDLVVNEAPMTGESSPVYKDSEDEAHKRVLAGTFVISGKGIAKIEKTGAETELGKIIESLNSFSGKKTPLQKELDRTGKIIGSIVILLSIIMFISILMEKHLFVQIINGFLDYNGQRVMINSLITAIALAVAAVPEGLPTIVTLTLSFGSRKLLKSRVFVKRLSSVETLGSVDVICSDKTGTITEGKMSIVSLFFNKKMHDTKTLRNNKIPRKLLLTMSLCSEGDLETNSSPTEKAILDFINKQGVNVKLEKFGEIPFSHERKFMLTIHKFKNKYFVGVKGAPEIILQRCSKVLDNGRTKRISKADIKMIKALLDETSNMGLRNIGFACAEVNLKEAVKIKKERVPPKNLTFLGFAALEDKPRPEVKEAIKRCINAGIKPIMITGDYKGTAVSIGREVGIIGRAMSGEELDKLSANDLKKVIEDYTIFYRVLPSHKLKILKALQQRGHIVAMTGDGVNDAPALKKADIGIAVNSGTDVAKDSADMILLDNSFASIVKAVEEGRRIYSNIKKSVRYLLSSNLAEVGLIFLAVIFGLPLPLIAVQILWMNLLTDSFPAFALTLEPAEKGIMKRKPRQKTEKLLNSRELAIILFLAAVMSMFGLLIFTSVLPRVVYARTAAFTAIVLFELANVINSKSETRPSVRSGLLSNKILLLSLGFSMLLQALVVYFRPMNKLFSTTPLHLGTLSMIFAFTLLIILAGDIIKLYFRIKDEKQELAQFSALETLKTSTANK